LEITAGATPGSLTVASGATLTTGGLLTLNSDASGTARVANSAGTISGNVIVQRYIPGGNRRFRLLSHPFNAARPLNILSGVSYTGNGGTTNGFTHTTSTNNPSVFSFTTANANSASNNGGWTAFSDAITANWGVGQGVRILVRGTFGEGLDGNAYTPSPTTISMTGAVNIGAVNVPLVLGGTGSAENFNLVGNPYPSPVNIEDVVAANANVSKTIYLRNPSTGSYITKDLSVLANADYSIPANAAFFVVPTSATNLSFDEANKVGTASSDVVFNQPSNDPLPYIELQTLVGNEVYDNMYIKFNKSWSSKFDIKTDAAKAQNDFVNVYAISEEGNRLAVDARSFVHNSIIPLGVSLNSGSRTLTIKASTFNLDADKYEVVLLDKLTNTKTTLTKDASYSFTVNMSEANTYGDDRLQLLLTTKNTNQPIDVIATGFKAKLQSTIISNQIAVNLENASSKTTIKVVNALGQVVISKDASNITAGTVTIGTTELSKGLYFVQVQSGENAVTLKATKP
ncbi:MAG: T9SS type A sorting domain-containing protein, partial [Chitinophagaceae bacterium]